MGYPGTPTLSLGVCRGYELTADLEFDTNGDGRTDVAGDTFWNNGQGWNPIGDAENTLNYLAEFIGNGHVMRGHPGSVRRGELPSHRGRRLGGAGVAARLHGGVWRVAVWLRLAPRRIRELITYQILIPSDQAYAGTGDITVMHGAVY